MNQIISISFLLIICITILMLISPVIDHFFYLHDRVMDVNRYKLYMFIVLHILVIGLLILSIHYFVIENYIKYFRITKHEKYIKLLIDLVITLSLIGLQRNLLYKIEYLSRIHPIRSKLIE